MAYLLAYNGVSAALWAVVLVQTFAFAVLLGQPHTFQKTATWLTVTQCGAVLEVVHVILGKVRSPLVTTASQVASRLLIVLGIFQLLPDSPANTHWVYVSLLLAWSVTEVVRYKYYYNNLQDAARVPYYLTWLRYSLFYVLYPVGVASEMTIVYMSLPEARKLSPYYLWLLTAILFTYPPGLYSLYTYMIKQRRKVLAKRD